MKKGFTLVELLAAIIVLGLVAVISVPSIQKYIDKNNKKILEVTAENLIETAKNYYMKVLIDDDVSTNMTFNVNDNSFKELDFKGQLPEFGYVLLNSNGNVGVAVSDGKYCVKKEVNKSSIDVLEDSECEIISLEELEEINQSCFILNNDLDTIIGYRSEKSECSSDVVIPASISGHNITKIGEFAFVSDYDYIFEASSSFFAYDILGNFDNANYQLINANKEDDLRLLIPVKLDSSVNAKKICYNSVTGKTVTKDIDYKITPGDDFSVCKITLYDLSGNEVYPAKYAAKNNITSVDFRNATNLNEINKGAFFYNEISEVDFGENFNIKCIEDYVFANNKITNLTLPNNITEIGIAAFQENFIENLILPNSIKAIKIGAFYKNLLKTIELPSSLTVIDIGVFSNNQLTSVVIPNSITTIKNGAFQNNQLASVSLPNSITSLEAWAFNENQLTNVTVPGSIELISHQAFSDNIISSLTMETGIKKIDTWAFGHNNLSSVTIPSSVTSIGSSAFYKNSSSNPNLTTIHNLNTTSTFNWYDIMSVGSSSTCSFVGAGTCGTISILAS